MERYNSSTQYHTAQQIAYEVLLKYSDGKLPIDPFSIIKKIKNIKLMTYTELATELHKKDPSLSIEEIKKTFESDRGFLKKKGKKKYILAYNEQDPPTVINWTLFHELGHYFLKHLLEKDKTLFYSEIQAKDTLEKEANCFARHCSCPFPLVKEIVEVTGISEDIPYLFYLLFRMGDSVTKYSSIHFEKYSDYYKRENYPKLLEKFNASLNENIDYLLNFFSLI